MKKILRSIPLASTILMTMSPTLEAADNTASNWYVSPMLSYIKSDDDRQADDGAGLMLGFGTQMSENWNLELSAATDALDFETANGEYKQTGLIVDGLYFFNRDTTTQTFAVIGAGVMSTDIGVTDTTNLMANIGVGVMQKITDSGMKLRADVRYRVDLDDESISSEDGFDDIMLNIGLVIPFGVETRAAHVSMHKQSIDSDNDGVMDSADKCPATAAGIKVGNHGCEIVQKVESPVVKDADNDGVVDSQDRCPTSVAGAIVDTKGCELQQSFVLKGVNFETSSDVLTGTSNTVLDEVAATLIKNSNINVEVAGYTDDRGSASYNQRLSQKRAESVKAYLVTAGVAASQMTAKGYGEDSPVADNATAQGRKENRRVEVHIIK